MAAHAAAPAFAAPFTYNNVTLHIVFEFCDQRSTALLAFTCHRIRSVYIGSLLMCWRRFLESLIWRDVRSYDTRCRLCPTQLYSCTECWYDRLGFNFHGISFPSIPGISFDMDCESCYARDDPDMGYCANCTDDDLMCCMICLDRTKAAALIVQRVWRRNHRAVTNTVARLDIVVVVNIASFLDYFAMESLWMTCRAFNKVKPPGDLVLLVASEAAKIQASWRDWRDRLIEEYGTCDVRYLRQMYPSQREEIEREEDEEMDEDKQ